jgi:transcriptional regulator
LIKIHLQVERMIIVYIPKQYHMNHDEAVQFMKSHPFALLVTVDEHRPIATHIPIEIREDDGKIYATGHIAYGNMQKKTLDNNAEALLIFQGPHAYISSTWYTVEEVPTWDYLAVHAYGTVRIQTKDELISALNAMLNHYESHRENGRLMSTFDSELLESEMKGIVGFEIEITSIQAAAKMSQNRRDTDYKNIVTELEKSKEQGETQVAKWMREQRKGLFE